MLQSAGNPKNALGLIRCGVRTGTAPGSHMDRKWILMRAIRKDSTNYVFLYWEYQCLIQ